MAGRATSASLPRIEARQRPLDNHSSRFDDRHPESRQPRTAGARAAGAVAVRLHRRRRRRRMDARREPRGLVALAAAAAHAARRRQPLAGDDGARHAGLLPRPRSTDGLPRTVSSRGRGGDRARHGRRGHDLLREHRLQSQPRGDRRSVARAAMVSALRLSRSRDHARARRPRGRRGLHARSASRSTRRSPAIASATSATRCACRRTSSSATFRRRTPAMHHSRRRQRDRRSAQYIAAQWDPALTWDDVEWLRSISPLPVRREGHSRAAGRGAGGRARRGGGDRLEPRRRDNSTRCRRRSRCSRRSSTRSTDAPRC